MMDKIKIRDSKGDFHVFTGSDYRLYENERGAQVMRVEEGDEGPRYTLVGAFTNYVFAKRESVKDFVPVAAQPVKKGPAPMPEIGVVYTAQALDPFTEAALAEQGLRGTPDPDGASIIIEPIEATPGTVQVEGDGDITAGKVAAAHADGAAIVEDSGDDLKPQSVRPLRSRKKVEADVRPDPLGEGW